MSRRTRYSHPEQARDVVDINRETNMRQLIANQTNDVAESLEKRKPPLWCVYTQFRNLVTLLRIPIWLQGKIV